MIRGGSALFDRGEVHVNIWTSTALADDLMAECPRLAVSGNVVSGQLVDQAQLDSVLSYLRYLRIRVVSVEVAP